MPDTHPSFLKSGEPARLIPVVADTSVEVRAASIFLATVGFVPSFASLVLGELGVRIGNRTKIRCFTEVTLEKTTERSSRPDGLIVVSTGKSTWTALIEAKIGRQNLDERQVRDYLELARANKVDALITLSNQFAALPTHHPIKGLQQKGISLFHWSWMSVLTQAILLLNDEERPLGDRGIVLREMVRYFEHPKVGASRFDRMNSDWKTLVTNVQNGAPISRSSPEVENSVGSWHQEERDLCLLLSRRIGRSVSSKISRAHSNNPESRFRDDCERLSKKLELESTIQVPDAAAPIVVRARVARRNLSCSMKLDAPKDKKRATARINWLLRQLSQTAQEDVFVRAYWPGKTPATQVALSELRENPDALSPNGGATSAPSSFEVLMVRDLAGRFGGLKTFIEGVEAIIPDFYEEVGQRLRAWVPPPPQVAKESDEDSGQDAPARKIDEVAQRSEPPSVLDHELEIPPGLRRYE